MFPAHSVATLRDTLEEGWEPLDHFSTVHGLFPNCALSVTRANAGQAARVYDALAAGLQSTVIGAAPHFACRSRSRTISVA